MPVRVRRLSVREYVRSVRALLGIEVSTYRFFADSLDTEFDNGPAGLSVQPEQADAYEAIAWEVAAAAVRDHRDRLEPFLDGFARRAFRRPLTAAERDRYGTLLAADQGLSTATAAVLQSAAFLYRSEIGTRNSRLARLDGYEAATALSYMLTGMPPDDQLLEAARAGLLDGSDGLRHEAERLLATPAARDQLRHFVHSWMGSWQLEFVRKQGAAGGTLGILSPKMTDELDRFYEYALFDSPGRSLAELLGSRVSFVDHTLGRHYGVEVPDDGMVAKVELDEHRPGVLGRAGFLTVHAGFENSNPIGRGVFVRTALLCSPPPSPPPNIPRVPSTPVEAHTTRERYAQHTRDSFCQGCHAAIDGVGFAFESFDLLGAYRTTENGLPVDDSGALIGTADSDGAVMGVSGLAERLRASQEVTECMARQLIRYTLGAAERKQDQPLVNAIAVGASADTPFSDLLARLIARPEWIEREVDQP